MSKKSPKSSVTKEAKTAISVEDFNLLLKTTKNKIVLTFEEVKLIHDKMLDCQVNNLFGGVFTIKKDKYNQTGLLAIVTHYPNGKNQ